MMHAVKEGLRRTPLAAVASLVIAGSVHAELVPLPATPLVTAAEGLYGSAPFKVAPDGSKVFFLASETLPFIPSPGRLYEVPVSGGPVTTRTTAANGFEGRISGWGFSPNETDLVFNTEGSNFNSGDAWVLPLAGGSPRQLTSGFAVGDGPGWSPKFSRDGSQLLFHSADQLYRAPLDRSVGPTPVNGSQWNGWVRADWKLLPGGNEVLYGAMEANDEDYNLYRLNIEGGSPVRVNLTDGFQFGTNTFAVDASGSRVAYSVHEGPAGRPAVMSRQLSGGPEIDLTAGLAMEDDVIIELRGFAGDMVVFQVDSDTPHVSGLYGATQGGGAAQKIVATASNISKWSFISPQGDAVLFTSFARSNLEAFMFDVATQSVRTLGEYPYTTAAPSAAYSSTGDHLLLSGATFPSRLYTADGKFIRSLPGYAQFHPDGEHVLYVGNQASPSGYHLELFMERVDGVGSAIQLSSDALSSVGIHQAAFASDGMTLFYSRTVYGQPLTLYAVQFVPEPAGVGMAVAAAGMVWVRRKRGDA